MTNEEAIKYLKQLYPNGGNCWLDEQRIEAIDIAVKALQEEQKQQWIEKACKWWENELTYPTMTQAEINWYQTKIAEFKKAMKGE